MEGFAEALAQEVAPFGEARHLLAPVGRLLCLRARTLEALGNFEGATSDLARAKVEVAIVGEEAATSADYFATSLPELLLFDPPTRTSDA